MNQAQQFLDSLASQDSNTVYMALTRADEIVNIEESQDYDNGRSTWTFEDGSAIVMEGADVMAVEQGEAS